MKFRPLCIDYRARAHEIAAAERDIFARRMAMRLLPPNPPSTPPCDLRRGSQGNVRFETDGIGPTSSSGGVVGRGEDDDAPPPPPRLDSSVDDSNVEGDPRADDGRIVEDVDGEIDGNVVVESSNDERRVDPSLGRTRRSNIANENDGDASRGRILLRMDMLGPAVHPSECTLRYTSPVMRGPVRGNAMPISRENDSYTKFLEDIDERYAAHVDGKLHAAIASLDAGRSRFDRKCDDCVRRGHSSTDPSMRIWLRDVLHHRATFAETMDVVHGRRGGILCDDVCDDYPRRTVLDDEKVAHISRIWTQHVRDMQLPNSIYLRHEPDDLLSRVNGTGGSLRSSAASSFACDILRSFGPRPRTSTRDDGRGATIGGRGRTSGVISAKPSFDANAFGISATCREPDCNSSSYSVPFAKLLDFDRDDGSIGQIDATDVLAAVDGRGRCNIRLDPDFDPQCQLLPEKDCAIHERIKLLDKNCSASSVLALFQRPSRFKKSHELSTRPAKDISRLGFFSTPLNVCNESDDVDDTLESLLLFYETRAAMSSTKFQPRKIRTDADISTPVSLGADIEIPISFRSGDTLPKESTLKSISASSLKLPSFYDTVIGARKSIAIAGSQSGGVNQKHFVESSSSVSKMVSLKNLVSSSRMTSLFLPQIAAENSTRARAENNVPKSTREEPTPTAIASAIRSLVQYDPKNTEEGDIKFFREQCSTYPVASWFEKISELDEEFLKVKRRSFCDKAISKSRDEDIRCMLLTGCLSKRNYKNKYSYRGFLTNQVVDPEVFRRRYIAMVQVDKSLKRKRNQNSLEGRLPSPAHKAIFTPLVVRVYVEAFSRHKEKNSFGRGVPYSAKLTTSRHGQGQNTVSTTNEKNLNKGTTRFFIDIEPIEELANCLHDRSAQEVDADYAESGGWGAVEAQGRDSLKTRGELLHLVTKARELENEKKSYLTDMAVANRSFVGAGSIEADAGVDILYSSPHMIDTIDLMVSEDHHRVEKRKIESDPSLDEQHEKKNKTEKKKDKKRKEKKKRKKHRKRKHRDDEPGDDLTKSKALETVSQEKQSRISSSATLNNARMRVLVPSIPLGDMTPIIPSIQLESRKKTGANELSGSQIERLARLETGDPPYSPAEFETSPDSVTTLNRRSETEVHSFGVGQFHNFVHTFDGIDESKQESSNHESVDQGEVNENESAFTIDSIDAPSEVRPPRNLLTSETFLEASGHIVAELATGRWRNALSMSENSGFDDSTQQIAIIDCPLLDVAGVDIELSDDSAIIVQYLSSWSLENDQNGNTRGKVSSIQRGARAFIRRLVFLAASGRYDAIHVILCLDVEMSKALSGDIVTLQNAVVQQIGCPTETVSFEYVGSRALSASIAMRLMSAPAEIGGLHFISDQDVQERARFLITLVPTMTVHMALRCCLDNSIGTNSLCELFEVARNTSREMFPYKMDGILSKCASDQLWSAVNMDISHAY